MWSPYNRAIYNRVLLYFKQKSYTVSKLKHVFSFHSLVILFMHYEVHCDKNRSRYFEMRSGEKPETFTPRKAARRVG